MLSSYGKGECLTIIIIGLMLAVTSLIIGWWWLTILIILLALALLAFFRDPERRIPVQRSVVVSPSDGKVSSIHEIEHFAPLGESALCIRVFLSVLDVHVNRSPCHAAVGPVTHTPGKHLNALNPDSAEVNESVMIVLLHPSRRHPIAAVRQVAGLIARTIVCGVREGHILQRGQRFGLIKFGSTTELYLPLSASPKVAVTIGQRVTGGVTVLAQVQPMQDHATTTATTAAAPTPEPTPAPPVAEPEPASEPTDEGESAPNPESAAPDETEPPSQ